jgi:hypothetical protein
VLLLAAVGVWLKRDAIVNKARVKIERGLSQLSAQRVSVDNLSLALSPLPAIVARDFKVTNSQGCMLLQAEAVMLFPGLRSALQGELKFETVQLVGVRSTVSIEKGKVTIHAGKERCELDATPARAEVSVAVAVPSTPSTFQFQIAELILERSRLVVEKIVPGQAHSQAIELSDLSTGVHWGTQEHQIVDLKAQFQINGNSAKLIIPAMRYNSAESQINLERATLRTFKEDLELQGKIGLQSRQLDLQLVSKHFELSKIRPLLAQEIGIDEANGEIAFTTKILRSANDQLNRLKFIGDLQAEAVAFKISSDAYKSRRLGGNFQFEIDDNAVFTKGSFRVTEFGYQTSGLVVDSVDAVLKDFSLRSSKQGLSIAGMLEGRVGKVQTDAVSVADASEVRAPLKISVTRKGGYSVEGPVSVGSVARYPWHFVVDGRNLRHHNSRYDRRGRS